MEILNLQTVYQTVIVLVFNLAMTAFFDENGGPSPL